MGMIADELEHNLVSLQAILSAKLPVMVSGSTLMCGGVPVTGVAFVQAEPIYLQMAEIGKAMQNLPKAIRKLEDRIKKIEDVPAARALPHVPPQGFRR